MKSMIVTAGILLGMGTMPLIAEDMQQNQGMEDRSAAGTISENLGDAAITAKVNAAFAQDSQVSALGINVDTDENGHVTLRGDAGSTAEADRAVELARGVEGVSSVTNNIEVR